MCQFLRNKMGIRFEADLPTRYNDNLLNFLTQFMYSGFNIIPELFFRHIPNLTVFINNLIIVNVTLYYNT